MDADTSIFGLEDATPGSRACVRVRALLGRVGRAGLPGAFWCASPFLWPALVCSLCARPLAGWSCPFSLAFRVFRPGVPWDLVSCSPPLPPLVLFFCPFFLARFSFVLCFFFASAAFFSSPLCAPVVSGVPCFPARDALGLHALLSPHPPPLFFFFGCFSFVSCLFFLLFSSSVPCRLCGAGVLCLSWAVGCAGVCFSGAIPVVALCAVLSRPSGAGWCCVVLPVVFGCLLLSLAVLCCLLVGLGVVFWWCCPCLAAPLAALWFGVVCLGAPLPGVVFCGALLSFCGVLSCSALCLRRCMCLLFVSCRCVSAVCVLGCRAVRSLSFPPCAVLCCAVLVPLSCAVRLVCAVSGAWSCWILVSLLVFGGPLVALVAWRCRLVVCVGFGVRVCSEMFSKTFPKLFPKFSKIFSQIFSKIFSVFPVVSCSPVVSCGAVLPCGAVLWCPVVFFFFALLVALVFCFPLRISCKTRKNGFPFLKRN